jgi:hypothetical protein
MRDHQSLRVWDEVHETAGLGTIHERDPAEFRVHPRDLVSGDGIYQFFCHRENTPFKESFAIKESAEN